MTTINPNLASAALTLQNQQSPANAKTSVQITEETSVDTQVTASGNTQVTLSEKPTDQPQDYLQLNQAQIIQQKNATETNSLQQNQTSSDLTYASNLQNNSNYLQKQSK